MYAICLILHERAINEVWYRGESNHYKRLGLYSNIIQILWNKHRVPGLKDYGNMSPADEYPSIHPAHWDYVLCTLYSTEHYYGHRITLSRLPTEFGKRKVLEKYHLCRTVVLSSRHPTTRPPSLLLLLKNYIYPGHCKVVSTTPLHYLRLTSFPFPHGFPHLTFFLLPPTLAVLDACDLVSLFLLSLDL